MVTFFWTKNCNCTMQEQSTGQVTKYPFKFNNEISSLMSVDGIVVSLLLILNRFSRCLGHYLDNIYKNFEKAFPFSGRSGIIPWDRDQIGIELGTKHVIYEKFANFT